MDQERPSDVELQEPLLPPDHHPQEEADEIPPPSSNSSTSTASDDTGTAPWVGTPSCSPRPNTTSTGTPLSQPQDGWCDSCCGCGYREVVIVVAILRLLFASLCIVVLVADFKATTTSVSSSSSSSGDDDGVDVMVNNGPIVYPAILVGMLILTSIFSWVGALRYNLWLIAIPVVWLVGVWVVETTVALRDAEAGAVWFFDDDRRIEYEYEYEYSQGPCCGEGDHYCPLVALIPATITALFLYPHLGFIVVTMRRHSRHDNRNDNNDDDDDDGHTTPRKEEYLCCCCCGSSCGCSPPCCCCCSSEVTDHDP